MSLKKGVKTRLKNEISTESVVIDILDKHGEKPLPEIYDLFMIKFNKNKREEENFTKVGLWKALVRLEKKGDVEKIVSEKGIVYRVLQKSKILAELNSITFSALFEKELFRLNPKLVSEFQNSKHKKTTLDGLLMFLGFRILGTHLASQQYEDKDLRSHWLKSALDLEKHGSMTGFFDAVINEKYLYLITEELIKNFPDNYHVLSKVFDSANYMKKYVDEKGKGLEKILKDFVDDFNKEEEVKK